MQHVDNQRKVQWKWKRFVINSELQGQIESDKDQIVFNWIFLI
jgi:hypothetical protein